MIKGLYKMRNKKIKNLMTLVLVIITSIVKAELDNSLRGITDYCSDEVSLKKVYWEDSGYYNHAIKKLVNPKYILPGKNGSCVYDDRGLHCQQRFKTYHRDKLPENIFYNYALNTALKNPLDISVSENVTCAIDNGEVKCFASDEYSPIEISLTRKHEFINPKEISVVDGKVCVIDNNKLKCFLERYPTNYNKNRSQFFLDFTAPKELSMSDTHVCVIDENDVKCVKKPRIPFYSSPKSDTFIKNIPKGLINPQKLSVGRSYGCVLDDEGIKCWGDRYFEDNSNQWSLIKGLNNPQLIAVHSRYSEACALDDDGVKCWSWNFYDSAYSEVPLQYNGFINPKMIESSSDDGAICVLDDEGMKCFAITEYPYLFEKPMSTRILSLLDKSYINYSLAKKTFLDHYLNELYSYKHEPKEPFSLAYLESYIRDNKISFQFYLNLEILSVLSERSHSLIFEKDLKPKICELRKRAEHYRPISFSDNYKYKNIVKTINAMVNTVVDIYGDEFENRLSGFSNQINKGSIQPQEIYILLESNKELRSVLDELKKNSKTTFLADIFNTLMKMVQGK